MDNCERIAAALSGHCPVCGWYEGCLCMLCAEPDNTVRYRCQVCFNSYSFEHDRGVGQEFEGTKDGTAYDNVHHGKCMDAKGQQEN